MWYVFSSLSYITLKQIYRLPLKCIDHIKSYSALQFLVKPASTKFIRVYNPRRSPSCYCEAVPNKVGGETKVGHAIPKCGDYRSLGLRHYSQAL